MNDPFYRRCFCVKGNGGKKPFWNAKMKDNIPVFSSLQGAGNTADNAIKDLQKQVREKERRLLKEENKI